MLSNFALNLKPPYYAVIFANQRSQADAAYDAMGERMNELAKAQPGYLGVESVRGADGFGITVSYWDNEANIAAWKNNAEHRIAQETGQTTWYSHYETRVARVERSYGMSESNAANMLREEQIRSSLTRLKELQNRPDWPKMTSDEARACSHEGHRWA